MAAVTFSYRSKKPIAFLEIRLSYRITGNPNPISFYTRSKIEVSKDFWNDYTKNTKFKDVDKINLKKEIDDHTHDLKNYILNEFDKTDLSQINKDWFKNIVHSYYNPPQPETTNSIPTNLIEYIDFYVADKKSEVTKSTLAKVGVNKNLLIKFKKDKKHSLLIKDVNNQFKIDFETYCLGKGYAPNTIARALRFIKTLCRHAQNNGLEVSYQLNNIKPKYEKTESIYLTR